MLNHKTMIHHTQLIIEVWSAADTPFSNQTRNCPAVPDVIPWNEVEPRASNQKHEALPNGTLSSNGISLSHLSLNGKKMPRAPSDWRPVVCLLPALIRECTTPDILAVTRLTSVELLL